MPAIVTKQFRVHNAKTFITNLLDQNEGGPSAYDGTSFVYLSIGKPISWDETNFGSDDSNPPDPDDDIISTTNVYRDGMAASRINSTDVSLGIRRYNWTSGTVYTQYDDQDENVNNGIAEFFVYVESSGDIFKCLDNNNGSPSTSRPVKPGIGLRDQTFTTSDGYRWKFMAETPIGARKFITNNYVPILSVNVHPTASVPSGYADQKIVQENANIGSIEAYVVTSGGAGFVRHSGAFTTRIISSDPPTSTTTSFILSSDSVLDSYGDNALVGATIHITKTTTGEMTTGVIDSYVASTRTITVTDPLAFEPENGDVYHIGPTVWVSGDGSGANAYSICTAAGGLSQVKALTTGQDYSYAIVTIDPSGISDGSGTSVRAILPPPGGHGRDPAIELNAFNVLINKTVLGAGTSNNYPITNDYRVISLLRNPLLSNGYNQTVLTPATSGANWFANTDTVHMSTWVVCNTTNYSKVGSNPDEKMQVFNDWHSNLGPQPDDEVEGVNSGAKARVVEFNADGRGILNMTNVVLNSSGGTFSPTEAIRLTRTYNGFVPTTNNYVIANGYSDDWSADTTTIPGTTFDVVQVGEIEPSTGEILYIENRTPVSRAAEQRETATIVIEF